MNLQVSHEWADRAAKVIPGGASTLSKGPAAFPDKYPRFMSYGQGARVRDVDQNLYTDWICGLGAMGLGYDHPNVMQAVERSMWDGKLGSFSLPTPLEVEVAEALVDLIPCAEMVRFTKTGSEACSGAIRLARDFTNRTAIAVCGYHGWHDWYAASLAHHPGVPEDLEWLVRPFEYNNIASLRAALNASVAAVIMEPVLHIAPAPEFLAEVARLVEQNGSLLIFDENVTGFRVDLRGAQRYYGVTPDLAVFGKAMSNGFPLAAIVGRREILKNGEYISGTFGGETVSLSAAKATIKTYKDTGCISRMHQLGLQLLGDVREVLSADFTVDGLPWKPRISATTDPRRLAGLCVGLAKRGHLIHPRGFYISCAHNHEDVKSFVLAASEAQNDPWENVAPARGVSWLRV